MALYLCKIGVHEKIIGTDMNLAIAIHEIPRFFLTFPDKLLFGFPFREVPFLARIKISGWNQVDMGLVSS